MAAFGALDRKRWFNLYSTPDPGFNMNEPRGHDTNYL